MPYDINGKCIHVYKQVGRHKEGKVFRCDICGETVRAKENKPMFDSDMRLITDKNGDCGGAMGDEEKETSIGMGDKETPAGDTEAL